MAGFTTDEASEMAIEIEKNGQVFYSAVAAQAADPQVKALFQDLAAQEQRHETVFTKMAGGMKESAGSPAAQYDEYQTYLQAALRSAMFSGPDKGPELARQAKDVRAALQAAVSFEKDTLLFFYDLLELVGEADRKMVGDIIREEKAHVARLAGML